jgi:hypothetical protein
MREILDDLVEWFRARRGPSVSIPSLVAIVGMWSPKD